MSLNAPALVNGEARRQLPEEVANYIRDRILAGELKPGEFLRMDPIAEMVGVSITPVREGLVMLSGEGLVDSIPRRGFVVAEITREDVYDIFWVQGQIAGELAARAAKRITEQELANLASIHDECNQAIARGNIAEAGHLRQQFHRAINLAAHSDQLSNMLGAVVRRLPTPYYATLEEHADEAAPMHSQIFNAIAAHDSRLARSLTAKHRHDAATTVIQLLADRGFWESSAEPVERF
ncbi:GntR family transcriptional regulator [Diaminobutyricibacter sp. McL0618]|uniref:GntR family transcriptional regulator n=1 Tax=Leifsonia sp. McL0618 TaxID=3415677 RepID=UPI003CF9101A